MMNVRWSFFDRFADAGYLVMRAGVGLLLSLHHGWPVLFGGPSEWSRIGRAVAYVGIHFFQPLWGFLAAVSLVVGGLCIVLGFCFRPAALALAVTMTIASIWKYYPFHNLEAASYPLALMCVCTGFFLMGAGKFSVDQGK